MCRRTSLFVGVNWIQFGSNLGHLNIEFLVGSGLVQFTLCSRRCLKEGGEESSSTTAKTIIRKSKGRSFWQDDVASVFTKYLHCIVSCNKNVLNWAIMGFII